MIQNPARDFRGAEGCQDAKPASAMNTSQDVCGEHAFHQVRPRIVRAMPFGSIRGFLSLVGMRNIRAAQGWGGFVGSRGARQRLCCGVVGYDRMRSKRC